MKKRKAKVLSVIMAASLAVGLMAGVTPAKKVTKAATTSLSLFATPTPTPTNTMTPSGSLGSEVVPVKVTDLSAVPSGATHTISVPVKPDTTTVATKGAIVPIRMEYAGALRCDFACPGLQNGLDIGLYSDASALQKVDYTTVYLSSTQTADTATYKISKPGVYYLKFEQSSLGKNPVSVSYSTLGFYGEDSKLSGSVQAFCTKDSGITLYHKVVMKKTGVLSLAGTAFSESGTQDTYFTAKLCNKNKKSISKVSLTEKGKYVQQFALKKGTYYVAVATDEFYQLLYKSTAFKNASGKSKAKAKTMKAGKFAKGMVFLSTGTGKSQWYKLRINKKTKINLTVKASTSATSGIDSMKLKLIPANSHYILIHDTVYFGQGTHKYKTSKLRAGTYYVQITKFDKETCTAYKLKYTK